MGYQVTRQAPEVAFRQIGVNSHLCVSTEQLPEQLTHSALMHIAACVGAGGRGDEIGKIGLPFLIIHRPPNIRQSLNAFKCQTTSVGYQISGNPYRLSNISQSP